MSPVPSGKTSDCGSDLSAVSWDLQGFLGAAEAGKSQASQRGVPAPSQSRSLK